MKLWNFVSTQENFDKHVFFVRYAVFPHFPLHLTVTGKSGSGSLLFFISRTSKSWFSRLNKTFCGTTFIATSKYKITWIEDFTLFITLLHTDTLIKKSWNDIRVTDLWTTQLIHYLSNCMYPIIVTADLVSSFKIKIQRGDQPIYKLDANCKDHERIRKKNIWENVTMPVKCYLKKR